MGDNTTFDYICAAVFVAVIITTPLWLRAIAPWLISFGG